MTGVDPEMVAIAENFFPKYMHAKVKWKLFPSGPAALAALDSGSLQFMTEIGNPPVVSAIAQGVPLQVIWAQERNTTSEGLAVKQGSGIQTLKDLKGKTVALVLGSSSSFEFDTALKAAGVSPSSVHILNMSPPSIVAAWNTGQIQAAYTWDPFFTSLVQNHGKALMYDQTISNNAPVFALSVVNSKWASTHQSLVDGFIEAQEAGVSFYEKHKTQAIADMAKEAGISTAAAKQELAGNEIDTPSMQLSQDALGVGSAVSTSLVTKSLNSAAQYLYASNTIQEIPSNLADYVNPTYVQDVASH
ncbi:taurine ABC transporter substrate-binding protein [Alicyclobacillus acidoterrestris]|nr:ABC transporter substrate-binding protein [Alicyclobacillus acidoterrestris]